MVAGAEQSRKQKPLIICPILTLGMIKPPDTSRIATLDAIRSQLDPPQQRPLQLAPVECVEELCGFYVPHLDKSGNAIGGACAVRLLGAALVSVANTAERSAGALDKIASEDFPLGGNADAVVKS